MPESKKTTAAKTENKSAQTAGKAVAKAEATAEAGKAASRETPDKSFGGRQDDQPTHSA